MKVLLLLALTLAGVHAQDREYWIRGGQKAVHEGVKRRLNTGVAKNVILFIGDGMGVSTVTAARILKGQMDGGSGEEYRLQMEKLPYSGLCKTYNTDRTTPDSAGTANAFLCGVKSVASVLGVDGRVLKGNCSKMPEAAVDSMVDWSLAEGKSAGIVTTTRITHATPAAAYSKCPHRDWESDVDMENVTDCDNVKDIATQLVENYDNMQVILGGGRSKFLKKSEGGEREDKDLVELWKSKKRNRGASYRYVENNDQLQIIPDTTEYLLGLFAKSHLDYEAKRKSTGEDGQPSIAEMFKTAHKILSRNSKGYFLLVEGGRIDHAHHDNKAQLSLRETIAMDEAIKSAVELTSEADTLIMVTADHSHVFTISGYPPRGHSIVDKTPSPTTMDGTPITTLMYANGPGPQLNKANLTNNDTTDKDFLFPSGVWMDSETHGGEDVAVFARGPMAHLVTGVQEQSVLAHIMAYASCVGLDKTHCTGNGASSGNRRFQWETMVAGILVFIISLFR